MKDQIRLKTFATIGACATIFAGAGEIQAQTKTLPNHSVVSTNIDVDLMGDELDQPLAEALEKRVISKKFNEQVESELGIAGLKIIRRAYAQHVFKPIWTKTGAQSLVAATKTLTDHAIIMEKGDMDRLETLVSQRFNDEKSAKSRAESDTKLTLVYMRKMKAVAGGLFEEGGADEPDLDGPMRSKLSDALLKAGQGQAVIQLEALAPGHKQYSALKSALKRYRELQHKGGWLGIPEGDLVEVGETDPRIPAIRSRLVTEGFYLPLLAYADTDSDEFTLEMETALKSFQRRHGLESDGVIGNNTLAAMNESVESKINKIADSMHRWRVQGEMGERYLWVNIPSYTAVGIDNGVREIEMKTIVGKPRFETQVFSDRVEYMVANPKWYLPISITRRQKVPKLKRDPSYAQRKGYHIFDRETGVPVDASTVDWTQPGVSRQYRFIQQPGPNNALGKLKIIFPNQYSIYLHGTPSKSLFDHARRAFSSGCVRLEDPVAMAQWIARGDKTVEASEIDDIVGTRQLTRLDIEVQVPVHMTYYLVTANEDGTVNFLRDIYDRDDGIEAVKDMAKLYDPKSDKIAPSENTAL